MERVIILSSPRRYSYGGIIIIVTIVTLPVGLTEDPVSVSRGSPSPLLCMNSSRIYRGRSEEVNNARTHKVDN